MLVKFMLSVFLATKMSFAWCASKDTNDFDRVKAEKACNEGDMATCFALAEFLQKTGDYPQSMSIYERVCNKQIEDACIKLGNYYDEKPGGERTSLKWYRKACQIEGASGLGCYEVARVAKRFGSKENSAMWLKKACAKGFKPAC